MSLKLESISFVLRDFAPEGKLWGRLIIHAQDTGTDTGRSVELEVLLDKTDTATFQEYEKQARIEAKELLSFIAGQL